MLAALIAPSNSIAEKRFPCRAGFKPIEKSPQNLLWVRSPKTGQVISIGDGWWPELRQLAPRLIGRIAQARSVGRSIVELSIAELAAVVEVARIIAERCKPLPKPAGGWNGWRGPLGRRARRMGRRGW
jgi:hypothetical protein